MFFYLKIIAINNTKSVRNRYKKIAPVGSDLIFNDFLKN